jgi:hypothetical protein
VPITVVLNWAAGLKACSPDLATARMRQAIVFGAGGVRRPQHRLRVGDVGVFHDVFAKAVEVLAIVPKNRAQEWLTRWGEAQ